MISPTPPPKNAKEQFREIMHGSPFWWGEVLFAKLSYGWFLVPGPLGLLWYSSVKRRYPNSNGAQVCLRCLTDRNSFAVTAAVAFGVFICGVPLDDKLQLPATLTSLISELAKTLFPGAFLLGTILSVNGSAPMQSLIKRMAKGRNPDLPYELPFILVGPFMWSVTWGLMGAFAGILFNALAQKDGPLPSVLCGLVLYGFFSEVWALTHLVRIFILATSEVARAELPPAETGPKVVLPISSDLSKR